MSNFAPGGASVTFGKLMGRGCDGTAPPGWIANSMGNVIPGGNGMGLRSIGTGVTMIWLTGLPSGPVILTPCGMVISSTGMAGVVTMVVCATVPVASSDRFTAFAVSSFGR